MKMRKTFASTQNGGILAFLLNPGAKSKKTVDLPGPT